MLFEGYYVGDRNHSGRGRIRNYLDNLVALWEKEGQIDIEEIE